EVPALAANAIDEKELIATLKSDASPREKDAACARLKRLGTELSIPALAALLKDEQLSHSARYALESMQSPNAGAALIDALKVTSGATQVGIADSLAVRREAAAVPELAKLLNAKPALSDDVRSAAAAALGEIATPAAIAA